MSNDIFYVTMHSTSHACQQSRLRVSTSKLWCLKMIISKVGEMSRLCAVLLTKTCCFTVLDKEVVEN